MSNDNEKPIFVGFITITPRGRKVTALGAIFNFTNNAANTTVQTAQDMVKESWFASAIAEEPDFFLLAGCVLQGCLSTSGEVLTII